MSVHFDPDIETTIPIHYINLIENLWYNWLQIGVEIIQTCNNKSQYA